MTIARDSGSLESSGGGATGGPSPFAAVSAVRTLVLAWDGGKTAREFGEFAALRGHEVRATQSAEECYWLVATGSVDVLAVAAAEVAVGLGIVISMFRNRDSVNVDEVSLLRW